MSAKASKGGPPPVALNRKAQHDYFIEQRYEAGLCLQGWEVKSLRAGKANISQAYVTVKDGELILLGAVITPLAQACAFVEAEPDRTRKLLMHKKEIDRLIGLTQRQGYTLVPLKLYWKGSYAKIEVGVAKGKKEHDKRDAIKDRQWQIDRQRVMKKSLK